MRNSMFVKPVIDLEVGDFVFSEVIVSELIPYSGFT